MKRYGFIRTKDEIKFLILYSLSFVKFNITFENILDICTWCDDGFDYFQFNDAFLELVVSNHIDKTIENKVEYFKITEKGIKTATEFEKRLPASVKELANISALRVVKEIRRDACIDTKITIRAENDIVVSLNMDDIFSMDFMVASKTQASLIEKQFKKNAEKIYNDILNIVTKDYN